MTKVDPYASNWLERLRHIKRFKGKVLKEQEEEETSGQIHDFTGLFGKIYKYKMDCYFFQDMFEEIERDFLSKAVNLAVE